MRPQVKGVLHGLHLAWLGCASLLVRRPQRAEWRCEWRSELWHVRASCTPKRGIDWRGEWVVMAFCAGALQDALCLRRQHADRTVPLATTTGSATQCVGLLLGLAVVGYAAGLLLPGVQAVLRASPYRDTRNLVLIQDARLGNDSVASIEAEQFRAWKRRRQNLFDEFAFYRIEREMVSGAGHIPTQWGVARGSLNLFALLGLPVRFSGTGIEPRNVPGVVLSDEAWKREFGEDAHIAGRMMRVGARDVRVLGVAPRGAWKLPGKVDAWVLEPEDAFAAKDMGFVVAHLKPSAKHDRGEERWPMSVPRPDGGTDDLLCVSLVERTRSPFGVFLFTVFLACLSLPATTSLPLGEYRICARKLSWPTRLRRWSFLAGKVALLLPVVYWVSLDLAHLRVSFDPVSSEYIQLVSSFSICLFGLRWTLRDQRRRCPVCLGRLTHAARVGEPSRNFLGWNGVELLCVGGHGLLHVPEIQTSWFSTQRWIYLDSSWIGLFAEPALASAGAS